MLISSIQGLGTEQIEDLARSAYGLDVRAKQLVGDLDLNFLLECTNGERFIFKVSSTASEASLEMQHRAMEHLARAGIGLRVPRVVPALDGREILHLPSGDGETTLLARMLVFLPGRLWVEAAPRPIALYRDLGRHLGELGRAFQDFQHPAAKREDPWDARQVLRHRARMPSGISRDRQVVLERVFHTLAACAVPHFGDLRWSVIHGDVNDHNLLVGDDGSSVSGLFDFGDVVETFTICELAVALAYAVLGENDPLTVAVETVAAYHRVFPLQEVELEVLLPLACGRLATSCSFAAERRAAGSTQAYHFVTEGPAWAALEKLIEISPATAVERWRSACGLDGDDVEAPPEALRAARQRLIGPSLSLSYDEPLKLVRGRGQYLYDHRGRPFLDLVNNVCHVGHAHPRVVAAGAQQMARLNTNTRYLYDGLTDYAARLVATFPEPLRVAFFVCSGSEANELALRLARTHTGRRDVIVLEGAYHGHTNTLIDISPYKFRGPGGRGEPEPWVHPVPMPDGYRGLYKGFDRAVGERYAAHVERTIAGSASPIAAFICESMLGCGGQVVFPEGFLEEAYRHVRAAGGVCIADEVQVGFGRIGTHFWAFEPQGVVPDIVVLGKPIGNGHPMSAVVTTPEIAVSFANGMELFSTFGGNPVSCAIGLAVLDVIEDEGLQQHALELGGRFFAGLSELAERHPLIGTVRGQGLFLGVELVRDRVTLEPAVAETAAVVERMRQLGMLLSVDGPLHNVIKIKPPMVIEADDVDMVVRSLDRVLEEVAAG